MLPGSDQLRWYCDRCGELIGDGDGWLTVDLAAVHRRQRERDQWERGRDPWQPVPIAELSNLPDEVAWNVFHRGCDPDIGGSAYWFAVERIRTIADVFDWWLHLSEKRWFGETRWDVVIRRVVMPQVAAAPIPTADR